MVDFWGELRGVRMTKGRGEMSTAEDVQEYLVKQQ